MTENVLQLRSDGVETTSAIAQTTNYKGAVAELAIAAAAAKLDVDVLKPLANHGRYDLVFDVGGRLARVQCKWLAKTEKS